MTAEERRKLLAKKFEEDEKDKESSKKNTKGNSSEKKGSAAKTVAGVAIGLGATVLAAGGVKSYIDSHTSETGDNNAIVYDTDDEDAEKTGVDKEIADEAAKIAAVQDKLTEASKVLSGTDNKLFATAEREGKFQDMIFDVDGDGKEEDFTDQFNEKLTSYQARLTQISAIEDETEKAVQFALLKEEMKDIKMILDTNEDDKVYENKIKVIQDGYNQNEDKAAHATYSHIASLYGEKPVFTYEGDIQDIERFADAIINGTDVDVTITAFETETRLEDGRFKNDESLLNGQEITLDLVNKREQVKTVTKTVTKTNTVYVPVVKPTPAPQKTVTPGPGPTPVIPDTPPVTPPTPGVNTETQTVVNPTVPVVQTEDQEQKLSETIIDSGVNTGVQPQEETQGVTNVQTGDAVYEGHETTQSYNFDAVVSTYDSYIEQACEEYAQAEVASEETQSADSEQQSAPESQAQPEEETVME